MLTDIITDATSQADRYDAYIALMEPVRADAAKLAAYEAEMVGFDGGLGFCETSDEMSARMMAYHEFKMRLALAVVAHIGTPTETVADLWAKEVEIARIRLTDTAN